jgi:2-polyprenyl-3-methyl-5-hydroxy-6-metoxy-1,4-benzoquinol methylase
MKEYYKHTTYDHTEEFKRLDFIVNQVKAHAKPGAKLLDIGCGNGNLPMALGSLGYNVRGIDVDETSIKIANERNTFDNVSFDVADANKFTESDEYDLIICTEVLEHLEKPVELVQSSYRILKPGGVMIATVPNGYGPRESLMTKPMQWMMRNGHTDKLVKIKRAFGYKHATAQSSNPDLTHIQFFTRKSLYKLMQDAGFKHLAFGKSDFLELVFPFSLVANRVKAIQKLDCAIADYLPAGLTNGFYTAWKK